MIWEFFSEKCNAKNNIFLRENGQIIANQSFVTNKFNNCFVNVSQNLMKDLEEMINQFQDYLKKTPKKENRTRWDSSGTKTFDTKRASHLYGISPKFIKISTDVIKTKLSLIINESFQQGVFPDDLKVGMVYPIHKDD